MKRFIKYIIFSLFICCALSACSKSKQAQQQMPPTVVNIVQPQQKQWQDSIQAIGSLDSFNNVNLTPEISGRVTHIYFASGQMVKKDQPLVQIFPDIIQAQLMKAKAVYQASATNFKRFAELAKKGYYDKADLDLKQAELESNKADVAELQAELNQTLVKAPFSGKLGLKQISVGDYLSPGKIIATLQSIDPLHVNFSVPENYIEQISLGEKINVVSHAFPNQKFTGKISAFNSVIDPNTRTLDMRADVPNPDGKLLPGTFVEVTVYLGKPQQVLLIPQTSIVYSSSANYVYLMVNHKAVKTKVQLGKKLENNQMIILDGLKPNAQVIDAGQLKIHDGSPVMTQEEAMKMFKKK